jgi:hypothetical protein
MRKFLTALVAVLAIGATTLAMSSPASAQWRGGYGWRGGWGWGPGPFIGGALLGGALAAGLASPLQLWPLLSVWTVLRRWLPAGVKRLLLGDRLLLIGAPV